MKNKYEFIWPLIGIAAVIFSIWLLSNELKGVAAEEVYQAILARGPGILALCVLSTFLAYAALAWYDRIAVMHVGRHVGWIPVSLISFTAYALSHNIGASLFSAGLVRYRAYSRLGLTLGEIAIVTAFCAFTFTYGVIFIAGFVLIGEPDVISRIIEIPETLTVLIGFALLAATALYQIGAIMQFKPLVIRSFHIEYPRPGIAFRQLFAAPIEIIGAAAIIYFALPETGNPGYFVVLGVFIAAFSAGLISNAPGGIGVFEFVFIKAMPEIPKAEVLAALIVFRMLYLLIPLALACVVVVLFERKTLAEAVLALMKRVGLRRAS